MASISVSSSCGPGFSNVPRALSILLSALFTAAACWSAGKLLLDRLRLTLYAGEEQFFRFVTGAACFSLLIFCLTAANLARESVFAIVGLSVIAAARSGRARAQPVPLPDYPAIWRAAFVVLFTVYGVYYFVNALAPETSPDGATYHLGLVSHYFRWHNFGRITTQMYASLSQGMEMLFLFAFAFGRHSAAAMMEFCFLLALPLGMLSYARRFGFPRAGVFGAVLVFASPVFGISGTVAYNDAAGACVLFAIFYLLQVWSATREANLIVPIGLLAGFAYGIKYTLFLAVPFAAAFLIWRLVRARQPLLKPIAIFSLCALSMIAPWLVKNWVIVANPFSPFLNAYFPNPYITVGFEKSYAMMMRSQEDLKPAERPLEQTSQGGRTAGFVGPVFLLTPLALFALRFAAGRQLLLAAAIFILPAFANLQTRFLMPSLPFVSLALGMALMEARAALWLLLLFDTVTCWPGFTSNYCTGYAWRLVRFPVAEALRIVPENETLHKYVAWMPVADLIDAKVPPDGRVLSFGDPPEAYTSRTVIVGYESAFGQKMTDILYCAQLKEYRPTRILTFAFPPRALRRIRVVQAAKSSGEFWSVAELRLYSKGGEVRRSPEWRLSAQPNPFDIQLAFDNNPATRWSSEETAEPGMRIEVDLGQPVPIDSVVLESSNDQSPIQLKLEGELSPGVWTTLSQAPASAERESEWDLRRAAVTELRARGITHLVVSSGNLGAADFAANARKWGFELLGSAAGANLYRLQP
jgi:hypothetical protein